MTLDPLEYKRSVPTIDSQRKNNQGRLASGEILIVNLGKPRFDNDGSGRRIGFSSEMSPEELRESARKYWKADPKKARKVRYLVAVHDRIVRAAYEVRVDGVIENLEGDSRRVEFEVREIQEEVQENRVRERAQDWVKQLARVSQNPLMYVRIP